MITEEKKQRIIEEYLSGYCMSNLSAKVKVKESLLHEFLIEYHQMKGLFYLDEYEDWICPIHRE